jgi:hypothetical protein
MPRACAVRAESKLPDTGVPLPDRLPLPGTPALGEGGMEAIPKPRP